MKSKSLKNIMTSVVVAVRLFVLGIVLPVVAVALPVDASAQRERQLLDCDWQFAFGDAGNIQKDFNAGTEYFNYLTKANSIHNEGPYSPKFDASRWRRVDLPFDFVVDLPFAEEASHSHGYKQVGYKYPATSVGWYRKTMTIDASDKGKHFELTFDGIFRDARVWVNGFYVGGNPSGYLSQTFDITDYLNYGDYNLICVRTDATLEEGWFYEGAGIYRHVWLDITSPVHIDNNGVFVTTDLNNDFTVAKLNVNTVVMNSSHGDIVSTDDTNEKNKNARRYRIRHTVIDRMGREVAGCDAQSLSSMKAHGTTGHNCTGIVLNNPNLWSVDTPYLYILRTELLADGKVVDTKDTRFGVRKVEFDADCGFLLNGKRLKLHGVNMHQDHAGVGTGMSDAILVYRIKKLKELGCNAYRSSHNPMTPAMLDVCDSLGMLVIDENRLAGISTYQTEQLRAMIERDRNHPSVMLWSIANEEWGIEWDEKGELIAATMRDYCHLYDPSRLMTAATSSGPTIVVPVDVAGYNYILQNPVEEHRAKYPERKAYGSEETTGCGTRGIYFDEPGTGRMVSLNRSKNGPDSIYNCIERGWKFYAERDWLGGCFFWTGFDYRGEPNPMKFPATGSEFGILDYCGFPKDEAYYLKSWWTQEPVLHILPHWNLSGHEGENIDVWVYSNCDEVELSVNGRSAGRKVMPVNGHLSWNVEYRPGKVVATGYKKGKKIMTRRIDTTGEAVKMDITEFRHTDAYGLSTVIYDVTLLDAKGRFVPTACNLLKIIADENSRIAGVGNGDPAFRDVERPMNGEKTFSVKAFNGHAQVIVESRTAKPAARISL